MSEVTDADRLLRQLVEPDVRGVVIWDERGSRDPQLLDEIRRRSPWPVKLIRVPSAERTWRNAGLIGVLTALPEAHFRALARRLARPDVPSAQGLATAVLELVREHLKEPFLVIIEDGADLDESSAQVLGYLARRLTDDTLRLVVFTSDASRTSPFAGLEPFALTPATTASVVRLIEVRHDSGVSPDTALIIARRADHDPSWAMTIIDGMAPEHRLGAAPLLLPFAGHGSTSPVELPILDPGDLVLLKHLSAAPGVPLDDLRRIPGWDSGSLSRLQALGLVVTSASELWLARQATRSQLYWSMDSSERTQTHRQLLQVSTPDGGGQAWHRFHIDPVAPNAALLARAAVEALREGRQVAAVEYAETSLTAAGLHPDTASTMGELAYAFFCAAEFPLAERYLRFSEQYPPSAEAAIRHAGVRTGLAFLTRHRMMMPLVDEVERQHSAEHPDAVARLLLIQAYYHVERWELNLAHHAVERAAALDSGTTPELARVVRTYAGLVGAARGEAVGDVTDEPLDLLLREPTLLLAHARTLTYLERYDESRAVLESMLAGAHTMDHLWTETAGILALDNEVRAGRFHAAIGRADALPDSAAESHLPARLILRSLVLRECGDEDGADGALRQLQKLDAAVSPNLTVRRCIAKGDRALHRGNFDEACQAYRLASWTNAAEDLPPQLHRGHPGLIEALLGVGDGATARRELDRFEERVRDYPSRWAVLPLARCRALLASPDQVESELEESLQTGPSPSSDQLFERARTLTALATRAADPLRRHSTATEAASLFRELGLPLWADDVERRARVPKDMPFSPSSRSTLNDQQRALVTLVSQGHTNEQIGRALHVSKRTVEARLTTLFRTVGVAGRAELIAWAATDQARDSLPQ